MVQDGICFIVAYVFALNPMLLQLTLNRTNYIIRPIKGHLNFVKVGAMRTAAFECHTRCRAQIKLTIN